MNKANIPSTLHQLIPYAEKWGIDDDGIRGIKIQNAKSSELNEIVNLPAHVLEALEDWLCEYEDGIQLTSEYVRFACLDQAIEHARVVLDKRKVL